MSETVRLKWFCGLYAGPPKWRGTECKEPLDCGTTFETEECAEEVAEKLCSVTCPSCGGQLSQRDDEPVVLPEEFLKELGR